MVIEPRRTRPVAAAMYGRTLDGEYTRYLLGLDLPEVPEEMIYEADTYLLTIIAAALLDGEDRSHEPV